MCLKPDLDARAEEAGVNCVFLLRAKVKVAHLVHGLLAICSENEAQSLPWITSLTVSIGKCFPANISRPPYLWLIRGKKKVLKDSFVVWKESQFHFNVLKNSSMIYWARRW